MELFLHQVRPEIAIKCFQHQVQVWSNVPMLSYFTMASKNMSKCKKVIKEDQKKKVDLVGGPGGGLQIKI